MTNTNANDTISVKIENREVFMVNEKQTNNTNNFSMQNIVKKRYIENDPTLCFDTIPIYKIIILTLVTTGLYQFILFYSWWKSLKLHFGYKVSPFWRAFYSGISVFWLFPIFEKYFNVFNIKDFKACTYALLFFFVGCVSNCIIDSDSIDNISLHILDGLLTIGIAAICCYIQNRINSINTRHYPKAKNNNWNLSNTIWTIICSIILILPLILGNNIK